MHVKYIVFSIAVADVTAMNILLIQYCFKQIFMEGQTLGYLKKVSNY